MQTLTEVTDAQIISKKHTGRQESISEEKGVYVSHTGNMSNYRPLPRRSERQSSTTQKTNTACSKPKPGHETYRSKEQMNESENDHTYIMGDSFIHYGFIKNLN